METENKNRAIWGQSCEGCEHVVTEPGGRRDVALRCFAPGPNKGYTVGINQFHPYIPAWCPEIEKGAGADGAEKVLPRRI